ncbi:hypothetical protein ACGFZS_08460 [Streptomyces sp. NPDC048288]|uniref:hypothetical protein n=1 Tax=Streptomyces sp. NPDC048288 TaxID=3365529 RepID=UPI003715322B
MQHRMIGFAALGVAATALCAVFASTALASPGATTKPQATAQQHVKTQASAGKASEARAEAKTKAEDVDENRLLLQLQYAVKVTTTGPTAAQIAKENQLVEQLKAKGEATADQLAWLALSPAQKRVEMVQVPPAK